ncbi:serine O-acetyltransferase [Dongshaea marina]|uniref:serine O-acetyltransferase n=1 Tax=Dongshaea marina TaxID=2047966 RepID=UPI0019007464|nr:serine O-acetyltransferase [Dongshaea marina]
MSEASHEAQESVMELWQQLTEQARLWQEQETMVRELLARQILEQLSFPHCLAHLMAEKLASVHLPAHILEREFLTLLETDQELMDAICIDLKVTRERDPACEHELQALLYFKGFHSLVGYRLAHALYHRQQKMSALLLQSRISERFAVDIHPAARIGKGIMIDHATGVVIGESAVVGDYCSLLHNVTLGGTGKECCDRHPKIGKHVLIGAGAKVLGNIPIGDGVRIAAGSVVLKAVPAHSTVAGVPAKVVGSAPAPHPEEGMDHISIEVEA